MIVDCMTCPVRGQNCDDCMVTALRAPGSINHLASWDLQPSAGLRLDAAESRVVSMFVGAGMVSAGAVATLRAHRESVPDRGAVRDVG